MPESKKVTLKTMVAAEVEAVMRWRPDLKLVKIADGATPFRVELPKPALTCRVGQPAAEDGLDLA